MDAAPDSSNAPPKEPADRSDKEFEAFLASIGWGSAYPYPLSAANSAAPPPTKLDAAITPAVDKSGPPALPRQTRAAVLRLLIAAILVLGVVCRNPLQNAVARTWARWAPGVEQREEVARGMVARAHLLALPKGIDANGVRDRVGLPTARMRGEREGRQEDWHYAIDSSGTGAKPLRIVVTMSNGRVVEAVDKSMAHTRLPALPMQRNAPQYLGNLKVFSAERTVVLRADARMATVLLAPPDTLAPGLTSTCRVLRPERVCIGKTGAVVSMPTSALYWRGVVYPLPQIRDLPPLAIVDDLQWLFKSLGCDSFGNIVVSVQSGLADRYRDHNLVSAPAANTTP